MAPKYACLSLISGLLVGRACPTWASPLRYRCVKRTRMPGWTTWLISSTAECALWWQIPSFAALQLPLALCQPSLYRSLYGVPQLDMPIPPQAVIDASTMIHKSHLWCPACNYICILLGALTRYGLHYNEIMFSCMSATLFLGARYTRTPDSWCQKHYNSFIRISSRNNLLQYQAFFVTCQCGPTWYLYIDYVTVQASIYSSPTLHQCRGNAGQDKKSMHDVASSSQYCSHSLI